MGSAMAIGLAMGGLSALGGAGAAMRQSANQRAQAEALDQQAAQIRARAAQEQQRGEAEAHEIDRRKSRITRQYRDAQAQNRTMLAAGNVDMSSGSARDQAQGNAINYAADLGENAYARAMRLWQAKTDAAQLDYQAQSVESQATYLKRTAGNAATSLLSGLASGATGFMSGYSLAGGSLHNLFGSGAGAGGLPAISGGAMFPTPSKVHSFSGLIRDIAYSRP